ncbi:hypothetical protein PENSUB_7493 [Penicillium subrubescens]|uniref:Uncharacterized protein n=1 Tax=Penicillium subrubescens TaxID=1316194 RepID=A0A1Q5TKZ9_9EURO|nr:hypothetical protein PENSUB_7493 [Penicillium subrubescens]
MREFQTAWLLHFGISVSVAATSASDSNSDSPAVLNFRPENVTLSGLYHWVGWYHNGTTHLEFFPYGGLASSEQSDCPDFHNKTITKEYTTVLGLSEPST